MFPVSCVINGGSNSSLLKNENKGVQKSEY